MLRGVIDGDVRYEHLMFVCPGCIEMLGGTGLHALPVNTSLKSPAWTFDGNLERPTLSPSILTYGRAGTSDRCHSFMRAGALEYLGDCTHSLAGTTVELPELPAWVLR